MKSFYLFLSGISFCLQTIAQPVPQLVPGNYQIPVQNIQPNAIGALTECIGLGNSMVFVSNDQLWITDGSSGGTQMLMQFAIHDSVRPTGLIKVNNEIYFFADDGVHGQELWKTNGTQAGTLLVKDIKPGPGSSINWKQPIEKHLRYNIQALNNKMYFIADDGVSGGELWSSDGTASGTTLFYDFYPGPGGGTFPQQNLVATTNKIFFTATTYSGTDTFNALQATDGTLANTIVVFDSVYIDDLRMIAFNDKVIFGPQQLTENTYISDGTPSGTHIIFPGESNGGEIAVVNNTAYFFSRVTSRFLKTDGTLAGTSVIRQLGSMYNLTNTSRTSAFRINTLGQNIIISGIETGTGQELWLSDGTTSGTTLLKDIFTGITSSTPFHFTEFNNRLYFRAIDSSRCELFYTDGTAPGTQKVTMPGANSMEYLNLFNLRKYGTYPMVSTGNALYYYAHYDSTLGPRIYKLDLLPAGIENTSAPIAIDIYPNPSQGYINIDATDAKSISIHSINGSAVYQSGHLSGQRTHSADIRHLSVGTYTVTTQLTDGTTRFGKFVKQ
ncbi:MAG: T9SS type A sorting domain-containing protein [Flavipsychrobacter sp.]|nr:T9SS type A sorting domain-containing protein [Flavipsychrobacter sp.]